MVSKEATPRFTIERSPEQAFIPFDRTSIDVAGYDVVDNDQRSRRVLAYRVRYHEAVEIMTALNEQEAYRRFMRKE